MEGLVVLTKSLWQVMTLDIHPSHPHMLVVGLYDGNVAVYNLQVCYMKGRKVDET